MTNQPDELSALRDLPTPRQSPLVQQLAARFAPLWGFVAYGLLYFFVALAGASATGIGMAFALNALLHPAPGQLMPPWAQTTITAAGIGGLVLSYTPIVLWARARRSRLRRLFRDGHWVSAQVERVDVIVLRTSRVTRAVLAFQDAGRARSVAVSVAGEPAELHKGVSVPVLLESSCRYVAAFVAGRAEPAR